MKLSTEQKAIVESPLDQSIRVLASAGSGKTRVLTERIRFILENTKQEGVVALTFTNKAAEEMENRLENSEDIEDRVWIGTIHSIAQRIIEKYGHTIGLSEELHIYERDNDRLEVFIQSLRDDGIDIDTYLNIEDPKKKKSRENTLSNYMRLFSQIKRELLSEDEVQAKSPKRNLWKIFNDYQNALLNSGGIDYDDILFYARKILITHEWIAKIYRIKYKYICVDEAQDLNKSQYELIKALCNDREIQKLFMVGDPDQMIYGFNGSSEKFLCEEFVDDFLPECLELKKNYRSTKSVIRAANKLRPNSQKVVDYALEGIFKIKSFESEEKEAIAIVKKIKILLEEEIHEEIEGKITLDNMVVIARNRFVFKELEKQLTNSDIPFLLKKGERQTEPLSQFGKILDFAIRLKLNPKDWVDGRKLYKILGVSEPKEWSDEAYNELIDKTNNPTIDGAIIYSKLIKAVNELDVENPNINKFVNVFREELIQEKNKTSQEEKIEQSLEELNEFNEAWTVFRKKGIGSSLSAFRNALTLGQLSKDIATEGLLLSTVHTMKGLEKDIVFLIGMCEGVFPDYRAGTKEEIEEERNSAFVAVTRAKRWLYITYPKKRMMPWGDYRNQRKSRFIEEIEKNE